jgi:hypothetical protein
MAVTGPKWRSAATHRHSSAHCRPVASGDEVPQEAVDRGNDRTTGVDDLPRNDAQTPHNRAGAR